MPSNNSTDTKVVSMQFDNQQFEAGVKQTIKSLDDLKKSLNFDDATKSLDSINQNVNKIDFSTLNSALEATQKRFSIWGQMGEAAVNRVVNNILSKAEQLTKSLTIDQVSAGWQKYESVLTSTRTMMSATGASAEDVAKQLKMLMTFADETSYSYADMADAMGKFAAKGFGGTSGKEAIEVARQVSEGIAIWAAQAGQNAQTAARVTYQMSQMAGWMKLQDWRSVTEANMATKQFMELAMAVAEADGTLEKFKDHYITTDKARKAGTEVSVANFQDTLTKEGWLTTDVFTKTAKEYNSFFDATQKVVDAGIAKNTTEAMAKIKAGGKEITDLVGDWGDEYHRTLMKAFEAGQISKTFTDSIDATKDAVSSAFTDIFNIIFGNVDQAATLFTDVTDVLYETVVEPFKDAQEVFAEFNKDANNFVTIDDTQLNRLTGGIYQMAEGIRNVVSMVEDAFTKIVPPIAVEGLNKFSQSFYNLMTKFKNSTQFTKFSDLLEEIGEGAVNGSNLVQKAETKVAKTTEDLGDIVRRVIRGDFANAPDRFTALAEAGYNWAKVQNGVNEELNNSFRYTDEQIAEAQKQIKGYTESTEAASPATETLSDTVKKLHTNVLNITSDTIKAMTVGDKIHIVLGGIADSIGIVIDAGKSVIDNMIKPITSWAVPKILNTALNLLTKIGVSISNLRANLRSTGFFDKVLTPVKNAIITVENTIDEFFETVKQNKAFQTFVSNINAIGQNVKQTFGTIFGTIGDFFKGIGNGLDTVFKNLNIDRGGVMNTIITGIFTGLNKIIDFLRPAGTVIKNFFEGARSAVGGIDWADIITNLGEFAGTVGKIVGSGIQKATEFIKDFFSAFAAEHSGRNPIQNAMYNIQKFFKTIPFKSMGGLLSKFKPTKFVGEIVSALDPLKFKSYISLGKDFVSSLFDLKDGADAVTTGVGGVQKTLSPFTGFVETKFKPAIEFLKPVGDTLKDVGEGFKSFFKNINWGTVVDVAKIGSILILANKIGKTVESFKGIADSLTGINNSVSDFIYTLASNSKKRTNAKVFKDIAIGIAILAGSLFLLCQVDSDKLSNAAWAIGILAGEIGALSIIMTRFGGSSWGNLLSGTGVLAFAGAIVMLASELEPLSKMNGWDYAKGAAMIAGIGGILIALMQLNTWLTNKQGGFGEFNKGQALKAIANAAALWIFAASIQKVVEAMMEISKLPVEDIPRTVGILITTIGMLSALAFATSNLKMGSSFGLLALVYAVKYWIDTLQYIAEFDTSTIQKNIGKIVAIVSSLVGMVLVISLITKGSDKALFGAAAVILSIGVSINLIARAIKKISKLSDNEVTRATIAIDSIIFMLGVAGAMMSSANSFLMGNGERSMKDMAKTFIGMGVAVVACAVAIKIIADIDKNQIGYATAAVDSIIFFLGLSTKLMSGSKASTAAWVSLSLTMIAMAVVVKMISDLITNYGLSTAGVAVGLVDSLLISLAVVFKEAGKIDSAAADVAIGLMIPVILLLISLVDTIAKIPDPLGAAAVLGSIDGMLLAMAGVTLAAQKIGSTGLAGAKAALLGALEIFGVSGLMVALVTGVASLVQFIADKTGGSWEKMVDAVNGLSTLCEAVGACFGKLIGGVIGGAITGAVENMDLSNLSTLVEQIGDFMDAVSSLDSSKLKDLKKFAQSASAISDALTSLYTLANTTLSEKEVEKLNANLEDYADALSNFGEKTTGLKKYQSNFTAAKTAAKALSEMINAVPKSDGLWQKITGKVSWKTISGGLADFGDAMAKFATSVQPLADNEALQNALNYACETAGPKLSELEDNLPTIGGLKGKLFGDVSWSNIGTGLAEFGQAMQDFVSNVKGLKDYDADLTYACETLGPKLIAFKSSIPGKDEDGLIGWFRKNLVGGTDNGWSTIGTDLADFGTAMKQFAQNLSGISSYAKDIDNADLVLQKITSLVRALGSEDFSITDLSGTINNLPKLGDNLLQFAQKVTPEGGFPLTTDSSIFQVMDKLTGYTGDYSSLQTFADGIKNLANSINSLSTAAIGYNSEAIGSVFGDLDKLKTYASDFIANGNLEQFSSLGKQILSTLATGLSDKDDSVKSAVTTLLSNAANNAGTDENVIGLWKNLGETLVGTDGLSGGISDETSQSTVETALSTIVDNAIASIDWEAEMQQPGRDLARGLASGIANGYSYVRSAMSSLATLANKTFTVKTQIGSPSKLYMKYGNWLMEGLAIGIRHATSNPINATERAAYSVNSAMYNNLRSPDVRSYAYVSPISSEDFANRINDDWASTSYAMASGIAQGEKAMRLAQLAEPVANQNDNQDYEANKNEVFTINVPLEVNGKQFARATATYTRDELHRLDKHNNRMKGIRD